MFSIMLRTNKQSTNNVLYFLHILFLLHIYTAFLTIVNSLNNNDNEAIIQLSVDTIHVVKPSDPRFSNIEENANDDDEKELLIALLTSFDDDYKNTKQNNLENSSETKINNEFSDSNNCTSSTAATIASSSSVSIRFIPPLLDFGEQSIAIPRMQTVLIINDDPEPLELQSLSGTTVQFYSSFFTQKTLSSNGGNTSINVYYLPRTLGLTKSIFTIKTNRGTLHYYVNGIGTISLFHLRPLIGATIPLNSTFEYIIHFYNPYNYSIDINEIYTSDENLIIELLSYKQQRNKIIKTFEHKDQWHLEPYQVKPIIKINYFAYKLERLHGFYCIKTNSNDTIIVPVEINVANHLSLYSNVDLLEFTPDNLIRSTARPVTIPVYVINNGREPVTIIDVRVTTANINYVTIHHEKVQVPSSINQLTKIAELTIHPHLIPNDIKRVRGSVQVYTLSTTASSSSSDSEQPILQIPFRATILHGSLDYDTGASYFYIPATSTDSVSGKLEEHRLLKLINRFNTSIVLFNVTTDKSNILAQYIDIKLLAPYVYMKPGQTKFPISANILKRTASSVLFNNIEASLTLHTNLSFFHLPVYLYNGLLSLNPVVDGTNGGIRRNDSNLLEYFIASIPVNASRTVKFTLTNINPIDINIEKISLTLPKTTIQLVQMQFINGSESNAVYKRIYHNSDIVELVIPVRHQAVFSLTISGASDPSLYNEVITFKTRYETINMNVKYRIISGSIDLENKLPLHIDVFPNRLGTIDITLHNRFDEPTDITRMEFPTYGNCFSFIWNTTGPNKLIINADSTHQIGKLTFDMVSLCNSIQIPSESTCYCGLNNHPEFKQRWEQHVSALNTYELDDILVTKFRNLWKEWTSLVRKQRIQTNIWLVTDQADVSWPVTIGFVWPSVLEFMTSTVSRTPIIIDYHLTLLNTTKAHNIVITNPSSTILQYSVELVSHYENRKAKKKGSLVKNYQAFDISTTFKRVELLNDIYKFTLQPNEQITFTASYRPKLSTKHEIYFVVRNNLTIIESILLRGEGGSGSLTVGNRKAGSSDIPLVLEMNEKQYKLCSSYHSTDNSGGNPILLKIVTLRNTGNIRAIIHDLSFGNSKCNGQGFSVDTCSEIEIEPNERYDLHIRFQPDYTLAEIAETLTLNTNIGIMTFPIIVRIPQRVLATCYQTIPRPVWEIRMYWLCVVFAVILFIFVIVTAIYAAHRLYYDFLARAELNCRMTTSTSKLFNLNDVVSTVQDEQKIPERYEARTINNKKEILKDENKIKDNEMKSKRATVTTNGNKENGEMPPKTPRTPDGSNTTVKSVAASPKAITNKQRRATTENGPLKSSKQHDTSIKTQPLKSQKSGNTEPSTVITSRSSTPPSNVSSIAVTDEENEPFTVPRPKRVSGKAKETSSNIVPIKSTTTIPVSVIPLQPTPSPPPPPQTTIPKSSSTRSELSEQRQHQQELSRSSDSINDQQWHKVSSNRSLRKGTTGTTTGRRETADEFQPIHKTNKIASNNAENPMVSSISSSRTHTSVSNQMTQTRRRRGRRPTRPLSPTHAPNLTKGTSLQSNNSLRVNNRELAFRQLTEQLWAAGLPSATTACSMSVRSRCSSAPPSERGGRRGGYDDEEENIDWDEPDKPDDDFGRYASQTEQCMEESNGINEWTHQPPSSTTTTATTTTINEIPALMSIPAAPVLLTNIPPKIIIPASIVKEEIEPLPFPQHGPGPIQRPNKLICAPTQQTLPSFSTNSLQSPETPDVLDQINRFLNTQNSTSETTPTTVSTPSIVHNSSIPVNDLTTSNSPWTTFSPSEWPSKYETSWSLTNIQSPTVSSTTTQVQNPFAFMSTMNGQPRPATRVDPTIWSSVLGTETPRMLSASARTLRASAWNDAFSSTVPSIVEPPKPVNNTWSAFWPVSDPSSAGGASSNGPETETNNQLWSLGGLPNETVISSTTPTQQPSSTMWWSGSSSDENNNRSQTNQLNDDTTNNRDKSRWDFAR
ncbi:unnamed protein product [Adineta steineri]|uniref:Transmembrane protein n=2 Tax=Adineta steineri TaxID=433720 RepID=A0A818UFI2_9BILA|nr:unnamed protein product [Adineta steineri]